jgi:hypothetical protein
MGGLVYIIHLELPLAHARHYVGWSSSWWNLYRRLDHHRAGSGARMMAAVEKAGIRWAVVEVRVGTRSDERRLKNRKDYGKRSCPVCMGKKVACFFPRCGKVYRYEGWLQRHQEAVGHG